MRDDHKKTKLLIAKYVNSINQFIIPHKLSLIHFSVCDKDDAINSIVDELFGQVIIQLKLLVLYANLFSQKGVLVVVSAGNEKKLFLHKISCFGKKSVS